MEHCFRAAACLILAFALLQANPITKGDPGRDIIELLDEKNVSCGRNVKFASLTNFEDHDCVAVFNCFQDQLQKAKTNCTHEVQSIDIDSLRSSLELARFSLCSSSASVTVPANSSDCAMWEQDQKPLAEFMDDIKSWIQFLNSNSKKHYS